MGLFLYETTAVSDPPRPRVNGLATASLVSAALGFITVVGFLVAIVLGHVALVNMYFKRDRGVAMRGRRLAISALWISYLALAAGSIAFLAMLLAAYAALPSPPSLF